MPMRYRPYKRQPDKRVSGGRRAAKDKLTALRMLACVLLLGGVLLLRAFFPAAAQTMRETVLPIMEESIDYRGAISAIGESLTGESGIMEVLGDIYVRAFGRQGEADVEVQAPREEEEEPEPEPAPMGTNPPIEQVIPIPAAPPLPREPEEDEEQEKPEAVAVFLAQQAYFYGHSIPANVSYAYTPLDIYFTAPVLGPVSSPFGFRAHPILGEVRFHFGTDIAVSTGTPIGAFAAGRVLETGKNDSWGIYIVIDHQAGVKTRYAHLSALYVQTGDMVEPGQIIASSGATGAATGPHLHFEIRVNGMYQNPEFYLNFAYERQL